MAITAKELYRDDGKAIFKFEGLSNVGTSTKGSVEDLDMEALTGISCGELLGVSVESGSEDFDIVIGNNINGVVNFPGNTNYAHVLIAADTIDKSTFSHPARSGRFFCNGLLFRLNNDDASKTANNIEVYITILY